MNAPYKQAEPYDEANRRLVDNTHPQDWRNPTPKGTYNLVVLGGGTAGLVAAAGAAGTGAKVALIENALMGGDCLNVGCVPSKGMIAAARMAHDARNGGPFGVHVEGSVKIDFAAVMDRVRVKRADLSPADSAERFRDQLGVDVYLGKASFAGRDKVQVTGPHGEAELSFSKACIATGGRAARPDIPGLDAVPYHTNETLYSLTELPRRLAVIGGGAIGCEMAQTFARLGSDVTLLDSGKRILKKDDEELAQIVQKSLERDGVRFVFQSKIERAEQDGLTRLHLAGGDVIECDALLVSAGRVPNLEGLNLEAAGVESNKKGVVTNDYLQTTSGDIYASGDVAGRWQFTHAADAMSRIVIQNALFFGFKKASDLVMPWCTYTDPELATVGKTADELTKDGVEFATHPIPMRHVDRAFLEGDDEGLLKVFAMKKGQILGGTMCCRGAGDMISILTVAMKGGIGMSGLSGAIYPYPTVAESIRKAGDAYNRGRLTPTVKGVLDRVNAWRR